MRESGLLPGPRFEQSTKICGRQGYRLMYTAEPPEACIEDAGNVLVVPSMVQDNDLVESFFGCVISPEDLASGSVDLAQKTVYLSGDLSRISGRRLQAAARVFVVRELSHGYRGGEEAWTVVDLGRVPVRVHGVGVHYRRFFDLGADHFGQILAEHEFRGPWRARHSGPARRPRRRSIRRRRR